ncbi:phosphoribosyltransferase [Flavobacteriaceae bacterium F89]|uniref:Phosphoribosyltransferase n=1 Tax=Cerina litoralis TaxID=2874477 RepID=A0AAE3EUH6_9FLAO|nr:phosphoribosyltransferase family protein [Cerina litoralis]MCG2459986.1 phosphoribosyltransferase [Cerina litoralis]
MFEDRIDAGTQLVKKLKRFKDDDAVVLAIPRGGLPIGAIVAKALNALLDVVLTKKIGHPSNKEYGIGAVSVEDIILTNTKGITQGYIEKEIVEIRKKLKEGHEQYYRNRTPQKVKGKTVIVVDDGIATGNTLLATVALIHKQRPKKIVVAVPVAPNSVISKFKSEPKINEVICIKAPHNFQAVGQFYKNFEQVSDSEAIALLEEGCQRIAD